MRYVDLQRMFDAGTPAGLQYYVKSDFLTGLNPDALHRPTTHKRHVLAAQPELSRRPRQGLWHGMWHEMRCTRVVSSYPRGAPDECRCR
jgi:hypothetical protein